MTIEAAIRALAESELYVTHSMSGNGEADITVQGDLGPWGDKTFYRWLCWLMQTGSSWVVEPPPHPNNDQGLAFVLPNLQEAVSLIVFLYRRRMESSILGWGDVGYAQQLSKEMEYTRQLYNEGSQGQR